MPKISVSIGAAAQRVLDELGDAATRSGLIDALLVEYDRRWRAALMRLRTAGWRVDEILACCDVLDGASLLDDAPGADTSGEWIAIAMLDAQRLGDIAGERGITPERWSALAESVASDTGVGADIRLVARERRRNAAVARMLGE